MAEATIRDVAREAQLSVASVSRALNGHKSVRPETRARIVAVADRLGYVPHAGARSLSMARSNAIVNVDAGVSILEALRARGCRVPSSCESGTCGTCRTRLLEGDADHRDLVLNEGERADHIMICVSRAKSPELVLDL